MSKALLELIDVLRAEIADLYRLRADDAARVDRLERWLPRPADKSLSLSAAIPADRTAGGFGPSQRPSSDSSGRGTPEQPG